MLHLCPVPLSPILRLHRETLPLARAPTRLRPQEPFGCTAMDREVPRHTENDRFRHKQGLPRAVLSRCPSFPMVFDCLGALASLSVLQWRAREHTARAFAPHGASRQHRRYDHHLYVLEP